MPQLTKTIRNFLKGLITSIEESSIPDGSSSTENNWITMGDHTELRRGSYMLGTDAGVGKSRVFVATKDDGTQMLWRARGRKIEYYDTTTEDWLECGTDILPVGASGEDVSFAEYHSPAGSQLWISSPNSGMLIKIMLANPETYADQYDSTKNYFGYISIKYNRMNLWGRVKDKMGYYQSHIDTRNYTTVTTEAIAGSGLTRTGTLAFKAAGAKRTCFAVTFTDGVETFTDDYNGILTGSAGGTGTINYMTGAYAITFAASATTVTATYQWEDATDNGIADFTYSATRVASEGNVFRQDDGGGDLLNVFSYGDTEFCMHKLKTWALTLTNDDTNANNNIFRDKVGLPYWRAGVATGDGVYYVNDTDKKNPFIGLLTLAQGSTAVIPISISDNLDLEDYRFDEACIFEWGDYILVACRHKDHTYNDTVFVYSKALKCWDKLDYIVSNFAIYNGVLIGADNITNNVFELFSGMDDDDSKISNYFEGNLTDLETQALKELKNLIIEGAIGPDQEIEVSMAFDNGSFVLIDTIKGSESYVDKSQSVDVGALTLGRGEAGGGGGSGAIPAYHYLVEFKVAQDKFEKAKIRFEAIELGYASVSEVRFKDLRIKRNRIPTKYR